MSSSGTPPATGERVVAHDKRSWPVWVQAEGAVSGTDGLEEGPCESRP